MDGETYDEDYDGKLVRMYGYFECTDCEHQWESAHVYCKEDTEEAVYGQQCEECEEMCMPVSVEELECPDCHKNKCVCGDGDKQEELDDDQDRSHRSDLCGKCQAGLPCCY